MDNFIDQDEEIRKKSFLLMIPMFAFAGLLWALVYYYYGAKYTCIIPGAYGLFSLLSLLIYRWYNNYNLFRTTQLTLILLLPCLLHLSLGNFVSSSAVITWSTLCPLGALAFHNSKAATYWLILFIAALTSVFFLQDRLFPPEVLLPAELVSLFFVVNILLVTSLVFFLLRYFVNQNELVKKRLKLEQEMLAGEREKSENLLLNILPASIAKRLKEGEMVIADEYPEASVLFADIVGFTDISQGISAGLLVENLGRVFTWLDALAEQYGLEKIKTIGDSYMVASGLSGSGKKHLNDMADFALSMMAGIGQFSLDGNTPCDMRAGIDTGTVIAGVIGTKKFFFDIWGDAVNTASRMESSGEPGKIQVSEKFYALAKNDFNFRHRGKTEIKGKGMMDLYFLESRKQRSLFNSPVNS